MEAEKRGRAKRETRQGNEGNRKGKGSFELWYKEENKKKNKIAKQVTESQTSPPRKTRFSGCDTVKVPVPNCVGQGQDRGEQCQIANIWLGGFLSGCNPASKERKKNFGG